MWVGAGYLHFTSYSSLFKGVYNNNVVRNIHYKDDLSAWIWTYFGYSWEKKKAFAFVRFQDRIDTAEWDKLYHFRPHFTKFYLGGDPYHWSFTGAMRNFKSVAGVGSYREANFASLYTKNADDILKNSPILAIGNARADRLFENEF